jgi:hypothetical protein
MTRKEQILNEAIDYSFVEENFLEYDDCGDVCDDRDFIQRAFEEGAKWADKTMIEKACKWLYHNTNKHIDDKYLTISFNLTAEMIENFRKAMEE